MTWENLKSSIDIQILIPYDLGRFFPYNSLFERQRGREKRERHKRIPICWLSTQILAMIMAGIRDWKSWSPRWIKRAQSHKPWFTASHGLHWLETEIGIWVESQTQDSARKFSYSIPFHSIPFHSIPFHSILFLTLFTCPCEWGRYRCGGRWVGKMFQFFLLYLQAWEGMAPLLAVK